MFLCADLILLNFFSLLLVVYIISRIKVMNTIQSIKIKIILILILVIYPSIALIFYYLTTFVEFHLLESYISTNFYASIQKKLFSNILDLECFNFKSTTWGYSSTISVFVSVWFSLFGSLDSLSIIFVFMSHIVAFLVICFTTLYFNLYDVKNNFKSFDNFKLTLYAVISMTFLMDLLFVTDNLLLIFFLAELSLIPLSFLMVKDNTVFWRNVKYELLYENKRPLAFYYLVFFTVASGGFGFVGLLIIYFIFGTLSFSGLGRFEGNNLNQFFDLLISFDEKYTNNENFLVNFNQIGLLFSVLCLLMWIAIKVPLSPVHIWLPKAHVEGSTESSMVLAGIILKITVYVLLRISNIPVFSLLLEDYRPYLLAVAATTALLGACGSLLTTDMKRITAYSSVSHMGIILSTGFFVASTTISIIPFIVLLLTHTIVSTAMFMFIGCIYKSRHGQFISRNKLTYGGLLFIFPVYFMFGIIIFANLNIPLTIGFVGELGVLVTTVKAGLSLGIILAFASFVLLLPMLAMLGQVLLGPIKVVDFLKIKSTIVTNKVLLIFYKQLMFNKIVWVRHFSNFYVSSRVYFSFILFLILFFGVFILFLINFINDDLLLYELTFLKFY